MPFVPNRFARNAELLTPRQLEKNQKKLIFHQYPSLAGRTLVFGSVFAGFYVVGEAFGSILDMVCYGPSHHPYKPYQIFYVVGGWSIFYAWMSHSLYSNNIKKLEKLGKIEK